MDNKNLQKLKSQRGSENGTRSQISRGTVRTGTRSRKSRHEMDFENMSVLEIEGHITQCQEQIKNLLKAKREVGKAKGLAAQKAKDQKPIDDELKRLRIHNIMLLQIKDTLIPFWDKLPKDS